MTDAPERIWATPCDPEFRGGTYCPPVEGKPNGRPNGDAVEYIRADRAVPKVKPLEWRGPFSANGYKRGKWETDEYTIIKDEECYVVLDFLLNPTFPTLEAAQNAVQDVHNRRILRALETVPKDDWQPIEPARNALEMLRRAEEAEAKLAKAVAALEIADAWLRDLDIYANPDYHLAPKLQEVRDTLAELKGERNDT